MLMQKLPLQRAAFFLLKGFNKEKRTEGGT